MKRCCIVEGKEAGKGVREERLKSGKRGKVVWLLLWLRVWPRVVDEVQLCLSHPDRVVMKFAIVFASNFY